MTGITIRKLPEGAEQRPRILAAAHGRSMGAEARAILLDVLEAPARGDVSWIEQLIEVGEEVGGADLPVPDDEPATAADLGPV